MLTTLEDIRLSEGERVVVSLGSGEVAALVANADDPPKLKLKLLDTGSEVWVGRSCVVDLVDED